MGYEPEHDLDNPADSVFCAHGTGFVVPWDQVRSHMHVDSGWGKSKSPEQETQAVPQRRTAAYRATLEEDAELLKIFERTYGPIKRDPLAAFRPVQKRERPDFDAQQWEILPEYLLVDGYNIIFAWDELNALAKDSLEAARHKLMDILCNYQGYQKCNLILVFDAYRVPGSPGSIEQYHNIHVVYTKEAETADMFIEHVTHEIGKGRRVRVATSDGMEQIIILGHGALRVSARMFHEEVQNVEKQIRKLVQGKHKMSTEITSEFVWHSIPPRPRDSHKGSFGTVLAVAGSAYYRGAALLAAEGALRTGAGIVTLASVEPVLAAAVARLPECCLCPCVAGAEGGISPESIPQLQRQKATVLLLGPGLGSTAQSTGRAAETRTLVQKLLPGFASSAVLDADGLNAAAQLLPYLGTLPHPAGELIVTPHPGEMARLTGLSAAQINADRENTACQYAEKWNAVVVLKGCRTVVAAPDGRVCTNPTGNPGLARGGSGDVLAGMTAALLACGLPAYEAAACAVYLHGAAADRAAAALGEYGMLPHDILSQLGRIFAENHR